MTVAATPAESRTPGDLEALYREAVADTSAATPATAIKWACIAAKYAGRLALASERMRELANERAYVRVHAATLRDRPDLHAVGQEVAKILAAEYELNHEPALARAGWVEEELATSTELLAAATAVRDQLAARTVTMAALRTVQGGRR